MKKKFTVIAFLTLTVLLFFSGVGCKSKKPALTPTEQNSDKEIYQKAQKMMKRDPEKSRLLFKEIMHLFPDSIYSRRAKIGIADSYFKQKDSASLLMAASEYQEYVSLYPHSPDAVYAKLQIAQCYFKQVKKAGRDQTNTLQAVKSLEAMVKMYPDTAEAEVAKKMLLKARLTLASHYSDIGISNFRLGAYKGAVARFKQVMDEYPEYPAMDLLTFYTGKCYYKMWDPDTAESFFQKIINSYPKSKYLKKATQMLKSLPQMRTKLEEFKKKFPPQKTEETKDTKKE